MKNPELLDVSPEPEYKLENIVSSKGEEEILKEFTPEQQAEIGEKQRQLSAIAYYIGKDYSIPVLLNEPGAGWYWHQGENHIKIDPKDLLTKPMEYLRFVIAHEAGHRRISRMKGVIPDEVMMQEGFHTLFNCVEDARDNNFVAEAYPRFKDEAIFSYDLHEEERKTQDVARQKMGYVPHHTDAGLEYLRQWVREIKGLPFEIDPSLPTDVQAVVKKTLPAAQDFWWRYPSREEAENENTITEYAKVSSQIGIQKIWPEFKKLVERDTEFQRSIEILRALSKTENGAPITIPPELDSILTEDEREKVNGILVKVDESRNRETKEFEDAVDLLEVTPQEEIVDEQKAEIIWETENSILPEEVEDMTPELRKKLKEFYEQKVEEYKKMTEMIKTLFKDLDGVIDEILRGKLSDEEANSPETEPEEKKPQNQKPPEKKKETDKGKEDSRKLIKKVLEKDEGVYEKTRKELLPIIDSLENDLREIFVARRAHKWEGNLRQGKRLNIEKRIQEKAKGVSPVESHAWERREHPVETDYDFSVLVDLSLSMISKAKIKEAFKACVVLAEVLNRLSINLEITGFNQVLHGYQKFGEEFDQETRALMGSMLKEVRSENSMYNDDGYAIIQASEDLQAQKGSRKFLLVLSDGHPAPIEEHQGEEYEVENVVKQITDKTNQKVIGLGIGEETDHVSELYPYSIPNITVKKLAETLADLIRQIIAEGDNF